MRPFNSLHGLLLASTLLLAPGSAAQDNGIDPPVDGNAIEHLALQHTFTDGYVTLMDVRMPTVAPNPGGWPLLIMVHGGGSRRQAISPGALRFAQRGFATVTYDVRGQGDGMALNDPLVHGKSGPSIRERIDLFEIMESATAAFPGLIDMSRIGVTGGSQGGAHSWIAAAHSGKLPPPNPWRTAPFPVIKAVVPINFTPDLLAGGLPGGNTISEARIRSFYGTNSGVHFHPDYFNLLDPLVRAEDYPAIFDILHDPVLDLPTLLQTSSVPVMASLVYDDSQVPSNSMMDVWDSIIPNAKKVVNLTTGGHNTPFNSREKKILDHRKDLWFHHYLKEVDNGADQLPPFRFAVTPADTTEYLAPSSLWDFREMNAFPPVGGTEQTWYLTRGNLETQVPSRSRTERIEHMADGIFSINDYISQLPTPAGLQNFIQLNALTHQSPSFSDDQMLLGEGTVTLQIASGDADLQVHAALFEDPSGRYITGGQASLRNFGGGSAMIEIPLNFTAFKVRKGSRLRLEVENLGWHRPPTLSGSSVLHSLPIFRDYEVDIVYGGSDLSRLTLPFAPLGGPSLVASELGMPRNNTVDFHLAIHGDSSMDGWNYQLLASTSGSDPGHFINGVHVPLNRDWLTDRAENRPGSLPILDFAGFLDGQGTANPRVFLSRLASIPLNISELTFVGVMTSPQGAVFVTNPSIIPVID